MASTFVGARASVVLSGRFAIAVTVVCKFNHLAVAAILVKIVLKLGGHFFKSDAVQIIILIVKDILMGTALGSVEPFLDLKLRRVSDVAGQVRGVGQHFAVAKDVVMHISVSVFLLSLHELAIDRIARILETQELGHVCWDGMCLESG